MCVALRSPMQMHDANATSLRLWSLETANASCCKQVEPKGSLIGNGRGTGPRSSSAPGQICRPRPPLFCARVRGTVGGRAIPTRRKISTRCRPPGLLPSRSRPPISNGFQQIFNDTNTHTHKKCLFEAEIFGLHRAGSENNPYFQVYVRYLKLLRFPPPGSFVAAVAFV